jgi:CheY-like chemotaxis protein
VLEQSRSKQLIDVLLVEDDVALADTIVSYFTKGGLTVRVAHGGSSALAVLEHYAPRVAILDYNLPNRTGLDLAFELRGLLPDVSMILMSGAVGGLKQEQLENAGIRVFVNKPLPLRSLYRAVRQMIP